MGNTFAKKGGIMKVLKRVFHSVIKEIDDNEMTLTALVSTGARDRMDEVLEPSGVDLKNFRKNPVVLWAHNYEQPPIGKALWVKRTAEGIVSKVKFASTEFAKEIYGLYKEGFLTAFSVGFIPKEWEDGGEKCNDGKKPKRTYKSWEMLEYSAVPVPANPEALSLAMQKGILKDDNLIESIQKEIDNDGIKEEIKEEGKQGEEQVIENYSGLDELLSENKLLAEMNLSLKEEITQLKYKLYCISETKNNSEIADKMTTDNVRSLIDGAIRKAIGKVN